MAGEGMPSRFYSRNRKKAEIEGDVGRNGMRMRSWNKLDCIYPEVKKKVKRGRGF
jgi:hypothetical protein